MPIRLLLVPTKGFAGGTALPDGGAVFVAGHAFVARIDIERARLDGLLHQPCFNDLHHVAVGPRAERLWVSNTGLGSVDVLDLDGGFVGSHSLLPAWVNTRRMRGQTPPAWSDALCRGWSTAPPPTWSEVVSEEDGYHSPSSSLRELPFHRTKVRDYLHPNHVGFMGERPLVTCLYDGSVRDLESFRVAARLEGSFPHDGLVRGDSFWLTTIDGQVVCLDLSTDLARVVGSLDTFSSTGHYGWCRGLHVGGSELFIGLTEVREGRLPKHRWSDRPPHGSETSVLCVDRQTGRLLERLDLTDRARHLKIYSLIPLEGER